MRKFSKIIAVMLILVMFATMAVACKKGEDENLDESVQGSLDINGKPQGSGDAGSTGDTGNAGDAGNTGSAGNAGSAGDTGNTGIGETTKVEEGNATIGDDRGVISTGDDQEVDENFHIMEEVTNDNGFIPDDEQGLSESERFATEASKYNFDQNPLIHRDRKSNKNVMPSFNIDDTGFVRSGVKLKDLKGKTLVFYSADDYPAWSYRNTKGETIDEWTWFEQLRGEIGLQVKCNITSGWNVTIEKSLKDMNAGKQCDVVCSSHVTYPSSLCVSRSITDLISINNIGSSPGVCKTTMDILKWGNTLRVIAPIGVCDVLWYNATLAQELGLSDPHKMWEADKWDWDAFKAFQYSIPQKTKDGKDLISMGHWVGNTSYIWPLTTGTPHIFVGYDKPVPTLINNWDADTTMRAWEFITTIANNTNYNATSKAYEEIFTGTSIMAGTMYTQVYQDTEYSKHVQVNWVPYPMEKAKTLSEMQAAIDTKYANSDVKPSVTHDGAAQFSGFAMLLPKKTAKKDNVDIALKFMELWATRFTETYFDNLNVFEYFNFNYLQRKQYFDFVTQQVNFGLAMNDYNGSEFRNSQFYYCFNGDPAYNVKTEATKVSNHVASYVIESLRYGE